MKKIITLVSQPEFFDHFNSYIFTKEDLCQNLAIDKPGSQIDCIFLLLLSATINEIFYNSKKKKNKIQLAILRYHRHLIKQRKESFLSNKDSNLIGDLLKAIKLEIEKKDAEFKSLIDYFLEYTKEKRKDLKQNVASVLAICTHLENIENPDHKVTKQEEDDQLRQIIKIDSLMTDHHVSFENFYEFYRSHKISSELHASIQRLRNLALNFIDKFLPCPKKTKTLFCKVCELTVGNLIKKLKKIM